MNPANNPITGPKTNTLKERCNGSRSRRGAKTKTGKKENPKKTTLEILPGVKHMPTKLPIPARVKAARIKRGLTQAQLAEQIGKQRPWIAAIENGSRDLTRVEVNAVARLARALETTIETLIK